MAAHEHSAAESSAAPSGDAPPRQDVITAFLYDGKRILLAQRSERVSTYPGHWAGISGYLEGDSPLEWALVELREECGVDRERLTLLKSGRPLNVDDATLGRAFRVFPFLFRLDDPDSVRRDWEAARFEWVDREAMLRRERQPTVPRLYEAFERVWPPWPAEFAIQANLDMALRWLRGDRTMGAGTLARTAASELVKLVRLCPAKRFDEMRPLLNRAAERLQEVRPAMAAVANLLDDVRQLVETADSRDELVQAVESLIDNSRKAEERVAHEAAAIIAPGSRVMTISFSGTVLRILLAAADKIEPVFVCEGRPLTEGRRLAEELQKGGVRVTLLTDAQAFTHMQDADMVLLGADTVLADRSVVNKAGSALLALAARHWHKPVIVAAETLKFVRDESVKQAPQESNPPSEVWRDPPPGIDVANLYFDTLPASLVDQLITENGRVA